MKSHVSKLLYFFGLFFLIFAFPLLPGLSSAKSMVIVVSLIYLCRGDFKRQIYIATQSFGRPFLISYLILFLLVLCQPILWQSYDFSLVNPMVTAIIFYYVSYLYLSEASKHINIEKAVYFCFIIQSILILFAILSQSFYDLTSHFRAVSYHHIEQYGRLRGNAVSGYQFFSLVVMYSFPIIYISLHPKRFRRKGLFLTLLIATAICTGRSITLSLALAALFVLIKKIIEKQYLKVVINVVVIVSCLIIGVYLLLTNYSKIDDPIMRISIEKYLIEPIETIGSDKGFESSSTDHLGEMYKKEDIKKYFVLGCGKYSNEDGSYFGNVDIGYYRLLAYSGYLGLFVELVCLWLLFYRSRSNLDLLTRNAFFLLIILLNFKGNVYIWDNNIVSLLVIFLFFYKSQSITPHKTVSYSA